MILLTILIPVLIVLEVFTINTRKQNKLQAIKVRVDKKKF
ncbi:hypothetical protein JM81_3536 [Maribacter sp. MAR_2009_72]|nr:hypothetical protein JM81_3536 [Maribacter sp. MAR_2009_72]